MATQSEKGTVDLMDTGILDLPDSEEELPDAEPGAGAAGEDPGKRPAAAAAVPPQQSPKGHPSATDDSSAAEQPGRGPSKESTVSPNPSTTANISKSRSVSDIGKLMRKARIVSLSRQGGGMRYLETRAPPTTLLHTVLSVTPGPFPSPGPTMLIRRIRLSLNSPPSTTFSELPSKKN